jgi:hypothetical protein
MSIESLIALAVGILGLLMSLRAFRSGHNSLAWIGIDRDKNSNAFFLETGLLTVLSIALISLGLQLANWI